MARISVKEKDLSWYYRQRQRGNLVVYMPGLSTFGPEVPTYVYEDNFRTIFGGPINVKNDYSFYMAESLIKSGIDVLFHRMVPTGAAKATGTLSKSEYAVTAENAGNKYRVTVTNSSGATRSITINDVQYDFTIGTTFVDFDIALKDAVDSALANSGWPDTCEVDSKVTIDNSFRILGKVFPAGATTTKYYKTEEVTDVTAAITALEAEWTSASTNTYHTITTTTATGLDEVSAKYEGSLGNYLTVRVERGNDKGLRYVYVYLNSALVEQFTVDFDDPLSKYYYESIKDEVKYIEFTGSNLDRDDDNKVLGECHLEGGKDYGDDTSPIEDVVANKLADPETFNIIKDPYGYYYDVIVNGGLYDRIQYGDTPYVADSENYNYRVDVNLKGTAQTAGTAVYLMSAGYETTEEQFYNYCGDSEFTGNPFSAAIGPWCYSQLVSNGAYAWLPGWYPFLVAWGNSISSGNPVWYAPAGAQRARVGSVVKRPKYEIGKAILDKWQNKEDVTLDAYKLNPIMNLKQYGYCVYGNSTLLGSKPDGSTSMLQSLGTRVLVNQIKAKAFEVALGLQFDQLTDNLFMAFKVEMGTYMDQLRYQGGLYDYRIIVDRTTVTYDELNQRTVPVIIKISPNPAAEIFNILCEVYPAGVTFTDEIEETGNLV